MESSFQFVTTPLDLRSQMYLPSVPYLGGCGVKISRLLGSGFGLGFGAFLTSFLPLSLLPMTKIMTQTRATGKSKSQEVLLRS
jgi:hypothetical protein